jgi:hypothetical protein
MAESSASSASARSSAFSHTGFEQSFTAVGRLGHRVVELQRGVVFVAQQRAFSSRSLSDLGDDRAVVVRALAARDPGAERGLAQVAALREGEERLDDRARQRDGILAFIGAMGARRLGHRARRNSGRPAISSC